MKKVGTMFAKMGLANDSRLPQAFPLFRQDRSYYVRFQADTMIIFRESVRSAKRKNVSENSLSNLTRQKFNGVLSKKSRQRIVNLCDSWLGSIELLNNQKENEGLGKKRNMNMLTLTLPSQQIHDDREIKRKLLMPFLSKLTKENESFNYLWKAETQGNGNIHFHMLLDIYIDKDYVKALWNHVINYLGYIDRFEEKHGHRKPETTRIESVLNKDSGIRYVAKYIMKDESSRKVDGRIWGCSTALSNLKSIEYSIKAGQLAELITNSVCHQTELFHNEAVILLHNSRPSIKAYQLLLQSHLVRRIMKYNIDMLYNINHVFPKDIECESWAIEVQQEYNPIQAQYLFDNDFFNAQRCDLNSF